MGRPTSSTLRSPIENLQAAVSGGTARYAAGQSSAGFESRQGHNLSFAGKKASEATRRPFFVSSLCRDGAEQRRTRRDAGDLEFIVEVIASMNSVPPPIGSPEWNLELERAGIIRFEVDALLSDAVAGRDLASVSAHDVELSVGRVLSSAPTGAYGTALSARGIDIEEFADASYDDPKSRLLECAAWFLFHQRQPGYAVLMNLRTNCWSRMDRWSTESRWCVRQLAATVIHGPEQARESVEYYLAVDPFETSEESEILFPQLVAELPPTLHTRLLEQSATVAWLGKRDFYARFISDPSSHAALARALWASCQSHFFQSSDARQVHAMLNRLSLPEDEPLRQAIELAVTRPIRAWVAAIAEPADFEFRARYPDGLLVALAFQSEVYTWLWGAELWADGAQIGRLVYWQNGVFPETPKYPTRIIRRVDTTSAAPADIQRPIRWNCVVGQYADIHSLLGRSVEFWGPGFR